jgi:hypothetical protein
MITKPLDNHTHEMAAPAPEALPSLADFEGDPLDRPLRRSRFLALVSGGILALTGKTLLRGVLGVAPAYANCGPCGPSNCCAHCSGGWCTGPNCTDRISCSGGTKQCWNTCANHAYWTCCDFYDPYPTACNCAYTDGFYC